MTITVLITTPSKANASIFDWSYDSRVFGYLSSLLKTGNQLDAPVKSDERGLPIMHSPTTKNGPAITKELVVTVTAYSSTPDQTDDDPFTMANGHRVHAGAIAANFLSFGTRIMIPELYGNKIFIVEDRMNKRFPNRIDIWFPNRKTVDDFGVQTLKIQIINY